jgi:ankyrin repeat protein
VNVVGKGLLLIGLLCAVAGCDGLSKEQRREIANIQEHVRDHSDALDAADQPGGLTALHVAMLNNYEDLAGWLLKRGANPNAPDVKGEAPLHAAAIFDRRPGCPMTRLLLAHGADVQARAPHGETPLHRAAFHGHTALAGLLLSHGADLQARDGSGETPLHLACAPTAHLDMIRLLIQHGADLEAGDQIGASHLHSAILVGSTEAVRALLEAGARPDATNRSGYTPLHYAAIFGRAPIAAELIRRGAAVNVRDRDGKTPLWRAVHAPATRSDSAGKSQVDTLEVAQVLRGAGGTE